MADKERASRHRAVRRDYNRIMREYVQRMAHERPTSPVIPSYLRPESDEEIIVFRRTLGIPEDYEGVLPGGWLASVLGRLF